jgi:glycyl-tRNA synthetase
MAAQTDIMEKIVALCRRRGFIFGSSEIYGGIGGFWDYGPLGTELKRNIKDAWWNDMVRNPPPGPNGIEYQMVGLDCSIIMNPKVWEASGHVGGFSDPMVDCKECKGRFRADQVYVVGFRREPVTRHEREACLRAQDQVIEYGRTQLGPRATWLEIRALPEARRMIDASLQSLLRADYSKSAIASDKDEALDLCTLSARERKGFGDLAVFFSGNLLTLTSDLFGPFPCPKCGAKTLTEPKDFNLMFESHAGAVRDEASKVYLRPETAQGIFANFKNVIDTTRVKLPFGIAQIGKAFRNEINPRNYTFRSREFEQMEIEFFCHPSEAPTWYEYWRDLRYQWCVGLGLKSDKLRLRDHEKDELAHYADACADIEFAFPFGVSELEGIANRTDFDLKAHQKHSKKDLTYFDDVRKERFTPYVIEPSAGVDRFALAVICEAYTYNESRASPEFMKFHPRLAPIKAAVFPLVNKDGMPEIAEPIYREIKKHFPCQYDARQAIGRRYARMDEAGTPFCFTIDGQTKEDGTVTVRDRNDASQIRIDKSQCLQYLRDKLTL